MGYYLSCMVVFNAIYLLRYLLSGRNANLIQFDFSQWGSWIDIFTIVLVGVLLLWGIIYTICILFRNDLCKEERELGDVYFIENKEDITAENYLGKFSLLILSGLSLPVAENVLSLILYIIFFLSVGIIYIKKRLIYMNPIITLFNFTIYRCCCKSKSNMQLSDGEYLEKSATIFVLIRNKSSCFKPEEILVDGETLKVKSGKKEIFIINNRCDLERKTQDESDDQSEN